MVAAAACAVAVLTGCTGGDGPVEVSPTADAGSPTATVSPSASPSVTASPTPRSTVLAVDDVIAQLPEEALTEDFPGADAFASYFLDNYQALAREQPSLFAALSDPACQFCNSVSGAYEQSTVNNTTVEGGDVEILSDYGYGGIQDDGTFGIEYQVRTTDLAERDPDGTIVREVEGGEGVASVIIRHEGHWIVEEVGAERTDE